MLSCRNVVRFALLGCGQIANKHAKVLVSSVPGAALVAVCDPDSERRAEFVEAFGVPGFSSLDDMMAGAGTAIDVVAVLTPTGQHPADVAAVVGYGKHVVVEKPMALEIEDCQAMIDACAKAGVSLFVVKQNRYNRPIQRLRLAIEQGRFGRILLATARVRWSRPQSYYDQASWRGSRRWDGGVFANQASHHLDLLLWLAGDVDSVFAYTQQSLAKIEAEDTGIAALRLRGGGLGVIEATTAVRPKDLEGSISILGERGSVEIGGFAVNQVRTWQFENAAPGDAEMLGEAGTNPSDFAFAHAEYLKAVVACLSRGAPTPVTPAEAMDTVRLIAAIYASAESRTEIDMATLAPRTVAAPELLAQRAG